MPQTSSDRPLITSISCPKFEADWKVLLDANKQVVGAEEESPPSTNNNVDPFDCSDLKITEKKLVEEELNRSVKLWEDLERLKDKNSTSLTKNGWDKVKLPANFDYLSTQQQNYDDDDDASFCYEKELYRIFANTRTSRQIIPKNKSFEATAKVSKQPIPDIRVKHRSSHSIPPPSLTFHTPTTTVLIEIWRRDSSNGRVVLEFLSTQTLQDVHFAALELVQSPQELTSSNNDKRGFIVIQGGVYVNGSETFSQQISEWLQGDAEIRTKFNLPTATTAPLVMSTMASIQLQDLTWSVNVCCPYLLVDVECFLFMNDMVVSNDRHPNKYYPVVHELVSSSLTPLCQACRDRPATLAQNLMGHFVCQTCYDQWQAITKNREDET